jgi:hypothetical protein
VLAIAQSLGRTCSSVLKKGARLKIMVILVVATWVLLLFTDGPHVKLQYCCCYLGSNTSFSQWYYKLPKNDVGVISIL